MGGAKFSFDKQYLDGNRISRIQCGISVGPGHSQNKKFDTFFTVFLSIHFY